MATPAPVTDLSVQDALILPVLVRARAEETPDHVFLHEVGGESFTYREFDLGARRFARFMRDLGVQRGEIVASFLPPSAFALQAWLGLSWLGAVEAPLNCEYRSRMLAEVLNDTGAATVVTTTDFLPHLASVATELTGVRRLVLTDLGSEERIEPGWPVEVVPARGAASAGPALEELVPPRLHETSCILYTSGTTGPSKGVVLPWAQMIENGKYIVPVEHMHSSDVFYCPYAPCHITGKAYFVSMMLLGGGYVIKPRFRTPEFWPDVQRYGCTTTLLQGAMAHFLLRQEPTADELNNPLTNVVVAPVIPEVDVLEERFGVRVGTVYNMTELSCPVMSDGWYHEGPGSCGRPRAGVSVRIVDDLDREVPPGVVGELVVRHEAPWTITSGYLGRPQATVTAFRNAWFHTGDAFYRTEDGRFFFVDRMKDSIRRRGENISSAEVEREVREYPGVRECAAVAHPSEFGEDEVRVVVVADDSTTFDPAGLHAFLSERMARYMLPRYIDVVESIPKTETQKIRKSELRAMPISSSTWQAVNVRPVA